MPITTATPTQLPNDGQPARRAMPALLDAAPAAATRSVSAAMVSVFGIIELSLAFMARGGIADQHYSAVIATIVICSGVTAIHAIALMFHRRCSRWLMVALTNITGVAQGIYGGVGAIMVFDAGRIADPNAADWQRMVGRFIVLVAIAAVFTCIGGGLYARRHITLRDDPAARSATAESC